MDEDLYEKHWWILESYLPILTDIHINGTETTNSDVKKYRVHEKASSVVS